MIFCIIMILFYNYIMFNIGFLKRYFVQCFVLFFDRYGRVFYFYFSIFRCLQQYIKLVDFNQIIVYCIWIINLIYVYCKLNRLIIMKFMFGF